MKKTRFAGLIAIVVLALFVSRGTARAMSEFCPATSSFHRIGDASSSLYSIVISAEGPRSVSGTIVVKADDAWYEVDFPMASLVARTNKFRDPYVEYTHVAYESAPLYVRFPAPIATLDSYVSRAKTNGDAIFGWDSQGEVQCSANAGFSVHVPVRNTKQSTTVTFENPRTDLDTPPPAGAVVITPIKIEAPGRLDCANAFSNATVISAVPPDFPMMEQRPGFGGTFVLAEVLVGADGKVIDTWISVPSGHEDFDDATLRSVRQSTFKNGTAFCEPAPGKYMFRALFNP